LQGRVEYFNPVAESLTGWRNQEAEGMPLVIVCRLLDEATRQTLPDPLERVLREGRMVKAASNVLLLRRDGTEIAINESAAPIRDRAGEIAGVVLVLHDVRREREYATQLSYQASHDALTGLINRREFEHRLSLALASARDLGRTHAMLYLDLDQFKNVNDTCGHAACYMAKEKGRNRVQLYHRKDSELAVRHGEMEWVARLHGALDANRFCLYSQRIVAVGARRRPATMFELLIRMVDEQGQLVPPMAF